MYLEQLKGGEVNRVVGFLNKEVYPELIRQTERRVAKIKSRGFDRGPWSTKRLHDLEVANRKLMGAGMRKTYGRLRERLTGIAVTEAEWSAAMLSRQIPLDIDFLTPHPATLRQIVTQRPVEGKFVRQHFDDLGKSTASQANAQIKLGIARGESTQRITSRVRKVTGISRNNAETLTRTSVHHAANQARMESYVANDDVIRAWKFLATLDMRTTFICQSEDGNIYPLGEGPIPGLHHRCRSTTTPVLRPLKELGLPGKEVKPTTRAAMRGQVPARQTYRGWLRKQPRAIQDQILGPTRGRLYRQGKVKFDQFVSNGRTLTLRELRALEGLPPRRGGRIAQGVADDIQAKIDDLTQQLAAATDPKVKKSIRAKLRRLRAKIEVKPPPPPPVIIPPVIDPGLQSKIQHVENLLTDLTEAGLDKAGKRKIRAELRRLNIGGGQAGAQKWLEAAKAGEIDATTTFKPPPKVKPVKKPPAKPVGKMAKDLIDDFFDKNPVYRELDEVDQLHVQRNQASKLRREAVAAKEGNHDAWWTDKYKADRDAFAARFKELNERKAAILEKHAFVTKQGRHWQDQFKVDFQKHISLKKADRVQIHISPTQDLGSVRAQKTRTAAKWLERITHKRIRSSGSVFQEPKPIRVVARPTHDSRSFQDGMSVNFSASPRKGTYVHELGHILEEVMPKKSVHAHGMRNSPGADFVQYRRFKAGGEPFEQMLAKKGWGDPWEWAIDDKFKNPYSGKWYNGSDSEVISMALEDLRHNPWDFLKEDREQLEWLIDVLRGNHQPWRTGVMEEALRTQAMPRINWTTGSMVGG